MFNDDLIEIFDRCVTRIERGESIDACLQSYPQHADMLHPMLEAIEIPRVAQAPMGEMELAKERVSLRFEQALNQPYHLYQPRFSFSRIAAAVVMLFFISSLLTTGVVVAAQDAIPGDTLYSVKRFSEQVRLTIAQDETALREEFAQRRLDETRQVIQIRREATVQFNGVIEKIGEMSIEVAGFEVEFSSDISTLELLEGMRVDITAQTHANQQIIASDIRIEALPEPIVQPTVTPTIVITSTATSTSTDTPIPTKPIESNRLPSSTSTPSPTATEPTATATRLEPSPTAEASAETTAEPDDCTPPSDWIEYTIQSGDTPSGIAVGTDLTLNELYAANCSLNPRLIVVGDVIYVPFEPRLATTITPTGTPSQNGLNSESGERQGESTQANRPNPTEDTESGDSNQNQNRNRNTEGSDGQQGR